MMPSNIPVKSAIRWIAVPVIVWAAASCASNGDANDSSSVVEPGDPSTDAGTQLGTPDGKTSDPGNTDASVQDAFTADTSTPKDGSSSNDSGTSTDAPPTCNIQGQLFCSGQCVDVLSNPLHCGACGHNCMGQACSGGVCAPITLSSQFVPLGGIAQDATTIYFVGGDGALRSVPKAGGTTNTIATGLATPIGVGVDATSAFVANQGTSSIVKVDLATGTKSTLASAQANPVGVVVSGGVVYWNTYGSGAGNGTVMKCAASGCNDQPTQVAWGIQIPSPQNFGPIIGLSVDSTSVYWANLNNTGEVRKTALNGNLTTSTQVFTGLGLPGGVASSGSGHLLVNIVGNGTQVWTDGPSGQSFLVGNQMFPVGSAVTDTDAYWTFYNPNWSNGAQVAKCPLTGCNSVQVLATGIQPAEGIVVDAAHVYWLSNDGTVMKTPR